MDQKWIVEAKKQIGTQEVTDKSKIVGWAKTMGPDWYSSKVDPTQSDGFGPWCGLFAAWCMYSAGVKAPANYFRAGDWSTWGVACTGPVEGCIVTFTRSGGGHVGMVLGKSADGNIVVIGGNQGNKVCVEKFPIANATAFRWPVGIPLPAGVIPVVAVNGGFSTNQA